MAVNGLMLLYVHRDYGLLGRGVQDVHLGSHTASRLCSLLIPHVLRDDDELMLNVLRCHETY